MGKLTEQERQAALDVCNCAEFASLPPSRIVPRLADQGKHLASESSFYRILRAADQQHHRGRVKAPTRRKPPTSYQATGPCQVWTWDITRMPGPILGMFYYLALIVDIYSRKITSGFGGWEGHDCESAELAATLVTQAVWAGGCALKPLVLHADNGSPMKGATMKATLEKLGIAASCCRPRVSNDIPFSEALFRTFKYRPNWPTSGFATKEEAQPQVKSFAVWYNDEPLHEPRCASSRRTRDTRGWSATSSANAPSSMQMSALPTRCGGHGRRATGSQSVPSGSTRNATMASQK